MRKETVNLSFAVDDPEIDEVLDLLTGRLLTAQQAISSDYEKAIQLRMESRQLIARGYPRYVCSLCGVPVYLICRENERRFHFRHRVEDGRCSAHTRGQWSEAEINARRYNGAKESLAHRRMKEIIELSLEADGRFRDVVSEQIWKGQKRNDRRYPDVQAIFNNHDLRIAFEVQLSTTFIRVIAERREFYLREGGLLFWIFQSFEADHPRLMQEDVFYNNNRNLFLVSEDTLRLSREAGRFMLECRWAEPHIEDGKISTQWRDQMVSFDDLIIDRERQRVFFFDYDKQAATLAKGCEDKAAVALRERFESFWCARDLGSSSSDDKEWQTLRSLFSEQGILLPQRWRDGSGPVYLLNALYSAKFGKVVGWNYNKLIEVAHRLAHRKEEKGFLWIFGWMMVTYDRKAQLQAEDVSGRWQEKLEYFKPLIAKGAEEYVPDHRFDRLVSFLFPEVSPQLDQYPKRGANG
jgi:hypothetical protein